MRVEIKQREDLTENETIALRDLSHAVYPRDEMRVDGSAQIQWSASMWSVLLWDDNGNLVTHIGMLTRQVMCDNEAYFIGGIGGVKTHPDAQGKGYAGIGMVLAAKYLNEECDVDFSLLVCSDEMIKYYQKFGWQPFKGDMMVQQTIGLTKFIFNKPMLFAGRKAVPECRVIDVCGKPW